MKNWILILLLLAFGFTFSKTIYFGPGQKFQDYETALQASHTGDNLIDCNEIDIKILPGEHWNWVSFPRLVRDENKSANVRDFLPNFQDWPFSLDMIYDLIYFITPTVEYDHFGWTPSSYYVSSYQGYKLNLHKTGNHILPLEGDRLSPEYKIPYPISARSAEWLGYWIPYPQNIKDAFGTNFENVLAVEAENWFYISSLDSPHILGNQNNVINNEIFHSPSTSVVGKTFQYGKGYVVYFNETVNNFQWNDSGKIASIAKKTELEKYAFKQKSSYSIIDFMNIPKEVKELGVFADSVCVGAAKIDDCNQQILVYPALDNREEKNYEFHYFNYDDQENSFHFANVFSKESGSFHPKQLIAGKNKITVINWNEKVQSMQLDNTIKKVEIELIPSPHVLPAKVKLNLAKDADIVFSVVDMNGSLIRQIIEGSLAGGEYEYEWDGTDNEGKNVSSGLYFYKLKTTDHEFSKKMLLLK